MGLIHPVSLADWQAWQDRRRTAHRVVASLRGAATRTPTTFRLYRRGEAPRVLAAVDATSPTKLKAVLAPVMHLPSVSAAILASVDLSAHLPAQEWSAETIPASDALDSLPRQGALALTVGHYLPAGQTLSGWAIEARAALAIVQHGLLTPFAPPLPEKAHLLAWSAEDAAFWASGRSDIDSTVVGSQLLWEASRVPAEPTTAGANPVFLGQLHGAELSRLGMTLRTTDFCLRYRAAYRPHPAETDALSRATHAAWKRLGVTFDDTTVPLNQVGRPVVAAFSTGLLEAAVRRQDAWAYYPHPPRWLAEFWERYRISRWGEAPTLTPDVPRIEPARRVADWIAIRLP